MILANELCMVANERFFGAFYDGYQFAHASVIGTIRKNLNQRASISKEGIYDFYLIPQCLVAFDCIFAELSNSHQFLRITSNNLPTI